MILRDGLTDCVAANTLPRDIRTSPVTIAANESVQDSELCRCCHRRFRWPDVVLRPECVVANSHHQPLHNRQFDHWLDVGMNQHYINIFRTLTSANKIANHFGFGKCTTGAALAVGEVIFGGFCKRGAHLKLQMIASVIGLCVFCGLMSLGNENRRNLAIGVSNESRFSHSIFKKSLPDAWDIDDRRRWRLRGLDRVNRDRGCYLGCPS